MVTDEVVVENEKVVEAPVSDAAPSSEVSSEKEGATESVEPALPAAAAATVYKPDYKLKVDHEEKELEDPFLKNLIKDADSEKKVKEIAQKVLAVDAIQGRHTALKEKFETYETQTKPIVGLYNEYQKFAKKGDLDSIFDLLGIPTDDIFKFAVRKAEERQLPAEQRAYIEQQKQVQKQRDYLESQNQTLQSQQIEQLSKFRAQELGWVMARPDVQGVASWFDAKNEPGAFREMVREIGLAHHARTQGKEDLSAEQAVEKAMKLIGGFVQPANAATPSQTPMQALIHQNGAPPIIPNITSGNASPVKKQVRSISDIKKRSEELGRRSS